MKKPAVKKTTAVKHPFTAAHKREDKIRRLRRELRAAEHSPASPKKTVKVVKAAKKPRAWSPDGDVALCSARAAAEALRLCRGLVLTDADVLSLYWSTASDPDEGQSILEALSAAEVLTGVGACRRPVLKPPLRRQFAPLANQVSLDLSASVAPESGFSPAATCGGLPPATAMILGLDLPWGKPHAVTYDPRDGTWWSWGQPYSPADFPGAVIEEAWAVTW